MPTPFEAALSNAQSLAHLGQLVHQNAVDHGFWEGGVEARNKGEMLALIHSEVSEVLEAVRKGNPPDSHTPELTGEAAEMADITIRVLDYCHAFGIDLGHAIAVKHAYNVGRPHKHGKKF